MFKMIGLFCVLLIILISLSSHNLVFLLKEKKKILHFKRQKNLFLSIYLGHRLVGICLVFTYRKQIVILQGLGLVQTSRLSEF